MPKPIKMTDEIIRQLTEEFQKSLSGMKLYDGKVSFNRPLTYKDDDGVTVLFEPEAYAKMLMLLHSFDTEVAWHGTVDRIDDKVFLIKDIIVYPQIVAGATVDTDQTRYQQWIMDLMMRDDDTFDTLRMQGHSHVNMGTTPSAVDTTFYEQILDQCTDDDFYIFMIFNKRLERTVMVYDLASNTLYENKDVKIGIHSQTGELEEFIENAKKDAVRKAYTAASTYQTSTGIKVAATENNGSKKNETVSGTGNGAVNGASKISQSPGFYGEYGGYGSQYGSQGEIDYDKEIFENRPSYIGNKDYWWNH